MNWCGSGERQPVHSAQRHEQYQQMLLPHVMTLDADQNVQLKGRSSKQHNQLKQ